MNAIDPASVPDVVDAGVVEALGDGVVAAASGLEIAATSARDRWLHLDEVFDVAGAEGVPAMLDPATGAAHDFMTAMLAARTAFTDAVMFALPALRSRREELLARVAAVNQQHADAADAVPGAEAAYWSAYDADPASSTTTRARSDRLEALNARDAAVHAVQDLQGDIERFRRDAESHEEELAGELRRITGGDVVRGAWGTELRVSQTYWGFAEAAYPMAPVVRLGLAESLRQQLSGATISRINWLSVADEADVAAWMAAHPDFAATVGFVDPRAAAALWDGLAAESVRDADSWLAGPLAQLLALAPATIGNLNGIRAADRAPFTVAALRDLLADESLPGDSREKLLLLSRLVDPSSASTEATLLSVFVDKDGEPRASVAFGDVDTADQITTLTHGIATDLAALTDWSGTARALKTELDATLDGRRVDTTTAVVLFFEWDSGSATNVWNIERPDGGAARLEQQLRGFEVSNELAQRNLGLHSLGTTMGSQMLADNPGLVQNVWLYGSAGVTETTRDALATQIADGDLVLYATHADDDFIAPVGRVPVSEHPVDPLTIPGVNEFRANGGYVDGPGGGTEEWGERTEGHNSQRSTEFYYLFDGFELTPDGNPVPVWDDASTGYLDPDSQSFKQTVADLARAAERVGVEAR